MEYFVVIKERVKRVKKEEHIEQSMETIDAIGAEKLQLPDQHETPKEEDDNNKKTDGSQKADLMDMSLRGLIVLWEARIQKGFS